MHREEFSPVGRDLDHWRAVARAPMPQKDGRLLWGTLEAPLDAADAGTLSQFAQEISYLLAVAGHDLRQPLQTASLVLERLHAKLAEPDLHLIALAQSQLQSAAEGLADLAVASRFGGGELPRSRICLDRLLHRAMDGWRYQADAKALSLRVIESAVEVETCPTLLYTMLRNLVGNAVQHTQRGGVTLRGRRRRNRLRIDVTDTGPGIAPELGEGVFRAFCAGDQSRGLGLGLALVRESACRLGAEITFKSRLGQGTRFSIELPA